MKKQPTEKKRSNRVINVCISVLILGFVFHTSCARLGEVEEAGPAPVYTGWEIPDGPVQQLRERTWDLHHQKLWVRFDFEQEQVIGETELLLTSEKPQSELVLDAKTMEFDQFQKLDSNEDLSFRQDSAIVTVELNRNYQQGDTLILGIEFVSSPPQRGLYFVNPQKKDPVKPRQVWTLGQPEDNSFWFPTIDHPAERTTQETWISVPPQYKTLSNGLLKESRVKQGDSLRTDYWVMNVPHAPYLFALAVGDYEIVEEIRDGLLYRYYTEPEYAETVDLIYENTVDMIRFSEDKTGMSYPWDPVYAQAPVHDFIARGMENTTATLLYDAVQFDRRASQDLSNQDLLMHEIIHQWLGNLVTAKDWANLPLNEGFANYFETAYRKHTDGRDAFLWKHQRDRLSYFDEAQSYRRPVIFNRYQVPEDMYDRHTYQKSGQILRMLHHYIGDDNWWDGLKKWVEDFSFRAVDSYDLQEVYEEVSGEDLEWFFDQWFREPGHPYLDVRREILDDVAYMSISQIQDTERQPLFELHTDVLIVMEGSTARETIYLGDEHDTYQFVMDEPIVDLILDPDRVQLAEYMVEMDEETLLRRLQNENVMVRSEALSMVNPETDNPEVIANVLDLSMNDVFWGVRLQAMELLTEWVHETEIMEEQRVMDLISRTTYDNEKHYQIRLQALDFLTAISMDEAPKRAFVSDHLEEMRADTSYFVSSEAIRRTGRWFPEDVSEWVKPYLTQNSYQDVIKEAVVDALSYSESEESMQSMMVLAADPGEKDYTYQALSILMENAFDYDEAYRKEITQMFIQRLTDPYRQYRMLSYQALASLSAVESLDTLRSILADEDYSEAERQQLKDAIRTLEYEKRQLE